MADMKYIYTYSPEVRDRLIQEGFKLLTSNTLNRPLWVFEYIPERFCCISQYVASQCAIKDKLSLFM